MKKATMPAIIPMTASPPTTPPAIAPAWLLEATGGGEGEVGITPKVVDVGPVEVVVGVVIEVVTF